MCYESSQGLVALRVEPIYLSYMLMCDVSHYFIWQFYMT